MRTRQVIARWGAGALDEGLASGRLARLRRGWVATAVADSTVVRAVRAGARLGCLDAARLHGLWIPPGDGRTHWVLRRARRGRSAVAADVVVHAVERWTDGGDGAVVDPVAALEQVVPGSGGSTCWSSG